MLRSVTSQSKSGFFLKCMQSSTTRAGVLRTKNYNSKILDRLGSMYRYIPLCGTSYARSAASCPLSAAGPQPFDSVHFSAACLVRRSSGRTIFIHSSSERLDASSCRNHTAGLLLLHVSRNGNSFALLSCWHALSLCRRVYTKGIRQRNPAILYAASIVLTLRERCAQPHPSGSIGHSRRHLELVPPKLVALSNRGRQSNIATNGFTISFRTHGTLTFGPA